MKILLLGANGQLGRSFIESGKLAVRGDLVTASRSGLRFDGETVQAIDLSAPHQLPEVLRCIRPDVIVNAAAFTAVDRAEQEEALAHCINGEAVAALGRWAASSGALVVHYSSDYVFDGRGNTPLRVDEPVGPVNAYGRSKLAGEEALRRSGAMHMIFRTAWVYAPYGQNFLQTMLRLARERDELSVVNDQQGTPTSTDIVVSGTVAALDAWSSAGVEERDQMHGTYHLVASGSTTWYGFATAIFEDAIETNLLPRAPVLRSIESSRFPTRAERPTWSVLDNRGMTSQFGYKPPCWREALRATMNTMRDQ